MNVRFLYKTFSTTPPKNLAKEKLLNKLSRATRAKEVSVKIKNEVDYMDPEVNHKLIDDLTGE